MAVKEALISAYDHNLRNKLKEDLKKINSQRQESSDDKKIGRWSTTWWQQFTVLLRRGVKERRHETFSGLKSFQVLVSSVITGLLWWQSDIAHLQDQVQNPNNYSLCNFSFLSNRLKPIITKDNSLFVFFPSL